MWSRRLHEERGQATLETAFTIMVVIVLLMGVFDLGRAVYIYSDLCQTARELAHYGSILQTHNATTVESQVTKYSALPLTGSDGTVDVAYSIPDHPGVSETWSISVTVSYRYRPVTPVISQIVGANGFIVVAKSSMLVE